MLNIAYRMIGDYDEACDVVQEISAFLVLLEAIGRVNLEKSPPAIPDTGAVTISMKIVAYP